jgi:myo-inositol 2-dehydrogenase/D-chiro-inositol 1-dehydrogenase
MVKIALVGTGYIGKIHASVLRDRIPNASVVAVTDALARKGRAFADEIGVQFYSDLEKLLDAVNVDAVIICTPTDSHARYTEQAAKKGKHVFCEKPLAHSLDEADRMIEAVHRKGVQAMSGHVLRFWPCRNGRREGGISGRKMGAQRPSTYRYTTSTISPGSLALH